MYNNSFGNPFAFNNTMPTATQPYGYQMPNYLPQPQMQQSPQNLNMQTNTNKIFVNGIEDVKNTRLTPNSDYIFLDNDKALLYQKTVDGQGKFEVKAFDIIPHDPKKDEAPLKEIDLSVYVPRTEFEKVQQELKQIKTDLSKLTVDRQPIKTEPELKPRRLDYGTI